MSSHEVNELTLKVSELILERDYIKSKCEYNLYKAKVGYHAALQADQKALDGTRDYLHRAREENQSLLQKLEENDEKASANLRQMHVLVDEGEGRLLQAKRESEGRLLQAKRENNKLQDQLRELHLTLAKSKDQLQKTKAEVKKLQVRSLEDQQRAKGEKERLLRRIEAEKMHHLRQTQSLHEQLRLSHERVRLSHARLGEIVFEDREGSRRSFSSRPELESGFPSHRVGQTAGDDDGDLSSIYRFYEQISPTGSLMLPLRSRGRLSSHDGDDFLRPDEKSTQLKESICRKSTETTIVSTAVATYIAPQPPMKEVSSGQPRTQSPRAADSNARILSRNI